MDASQEVKSLKKALRALTFLNLHGDATVTDVANAIAVPRPTSYRILETLAAEGYVEKLSPSGVYRLTSMVQRLATGFQEVDLFIEVAKPLVLAVGQKIGWPIALSTPRGSRMIVRVSTDHSSALALDRFNVGFAAPMLDTTCGYCYLAHCPEPERDEILRLVLDAEEWAEVGNERNEMRCLTVMNHLTYFNKGNVDEIIYLSKLVAKRGYCIIEFKQYLEGNIGVPLFLDGKAVGGIVMRYIKSAMKNIDRLQDSFAPTLQQLARDISDAYAAKLEKSARTVRQP